MHCRGRSLGRKDWGRVGEAQRLFEGAVTAGSVGRRRGATRVGASRCKRRRRGFVLQLRRRDELALVLAEPALGLQWEHQRVVQLIGAVVAVAGRGERQRGEAVGFHVDKVEGALGSKPRRLTGWCSAGVSGAGERERGAERVERGVEGQAHAGRAGRGTRGG